MSLTVTHFIRDLDPATGGPVSALANMVRCQTQAGIDVRIVTPSSLQTKTGFYPDVATGQSTDQSQTSSIAITPHAPASLVDASDAIHLHGVWEPILRAALTAARRTQRPTVWTPHGMVTAWAMNQRRLKKNIYFRLFLKNRFPIHTLQHFASAAERDAIVPFCSLARDCVIPLGIDTDFFAKNRDPDYLRLRHGVEGPAVLFVGRIHPGKGVEHLIAAANHLTADACTIVVAGPHESEWARLQIEAAKRSNIRFVFTGALPAQEIAFALSAATLYCLPSDHENFGMAAAEAMAAGTACLLSSEVAIAGDAVAKNAALQCRRDPQGLAADITGALSQPDRLAEYRNRSTTYAAQAFGLNATAKQWRDAYTPQNLDGH